MFLLAVESEAGSAHHVPAIVEWVNHVFGPTVYRWQQRSLALQQQHGAERRQEPDNRSWKDLSTKRFERGKRWPTNV